MDIYQILSDFGLPTAFLAVMIYLFVRVTEEHRIERKEWQEEHRQERMDWKSEVTANNDKYHKDRTETNAVLRELSAAIAHMNKDR